MSKANEISALPKLYSIKWVADYLGVCTKSVRRWIEVGDLPIHRIGRSIRISEQDLTTFVKTTRR